MPDNEQIFSLTDEGYTTDLVSGLPDDRLILDAGDRTSDEQASASFYPVFQIQTWIVGDVGLMQMPVAGALGSPARVVRKSAPFTKKIVYWKAQRLGEKPTLPHWDTGNSNEVLARFLFCPMAPYNLLGGSQFLWICEGLYIYWLSNTPCFTDDFYTGIMPLYDATVEELKIQGYEFSRELLTSRPPAAYTGTVDQQFLTVDRSSSFISNQLYSGS